ncbi:hypothetical protein Zm00014a_022181 [Zea mays]|uniref:RING-CH-type domain-containing protein n=2 Tax=Zea mays TaxID=4577 RepID=A0A3L6EK42_MAIZE|nr:hypothetical protein Zm00014a_004017 [Zea mays]PWZ21366.1 hypothetical protein Zm00014a_022181 [Zea mays]
MALPKHSQGAGAEVAADGSTSTSPMEDDGGTLDDLGQGQGHHEEDNDDDQHLSSSSSTGNKHKQTSCLLPARSLRSTDEASHSQQADCGVRSLSFSKILSFRMWAPGGSSSPTCLEDYIAGQHQLEHDDDEADKLMKQVCRSQSVPATSVARRRSSGTTAKGKGSRRVADSSSLRRLRVVPLRVPLPPPPPLQDEAARGTADAIATTVTTGEEEEDQDIAAEEAVCRICMVALSEEAVFKLECCCKGELALAHRACAIKWFSIKGNGSCDVCSQEVLNLPVTLRRLPDRQSVIQAAAAAQAQGTQADGGGGDPTATTNTTRYRVWHGTPILIIVSMLAYFCFLEQLLVGDHGTAALAISLPFACVLGLFSSLSTTKMVSRRYVWIYSAAQFLFIVLFTHIFYRYVRLQAVIAIILSAFAGFSVAICTNYSLLQILRWRRARHAVASPTSTARAADAGGLHGSSPRDPPSAPVAVAVTVAEVDLEIALPPTSAPAPAPAPA